jgi:hypothetical protein
VSESRVRYPLALTVAWAGSFLLMGLNSLGFGLSTDLAIKTRGNVLWILAAATCLILIFVIATFSAWIYSKRRPRHEIWRQEQRLKRNAAQIAAWRVATLDYGAQPHADDVIPVQDFIPSRVSLGATELRKLAEFELQVYQDTRPGGTLWIGQLNTANPTHNRWWYSQHPQIPGQWHACDREYMWLQSTEDLPHVGPGEVADIFRSLLYNSNGAFQAKLKFIGARVPRREEAWLRRFIQTFGHTSPVIAATLPETVRWDELHELLRHYEAFQARNPEFAGVPQDLALRMHGYTKLLDTHGLANLLEMSAYR